MAEKAPQNPSRSVFRQVVFVLVLSALLLVCFVWLTNALNTPPPAIDVPLEAELNVSLLRPGAKPDPLLAIEAPGTLPAQPNDQLQVHVRYNQPAYTWLLWLDAAGRLIPLYPWNRDDIEAHDADDMPEATRTAKYVLSPITIGSGWDLADSAGVNTVVLFARRTPLEKKLEFGKLLTGLPPVPLRDPKELAILALDKTKTKFETVVSANRGPKGESRNIDGPLLSKLQSWRDNFDAVHVVRFAQKGKQS